MSSVSEISWVCVVSIPVRNSWVCVVSVSIACIVDWFDSICPCDFVIGLLQLLFSSLIMDMSMFSTEHGGSLHLWSKSLGCLVSSVSSITGIEWQCWNAFQSIENQFMR